MLFDALIIPANRLWNGEGHFDVPCLFIDLNDSDIPARGIVLPPCPVIAIGRGTGALADAVDVIVPDAATASAMFANIAANPRTAAVIAELLRLLPGLPVEQGLIAESLAYGLLQGSDEHAAWLSARPAEAAQDAGCIDTSRQGDRLEIVLNRPWADNAIDRAMRDGLAEAFHLAALDETITEISLRGAGRSFSLGADLAEFGTTRNPAEAHRIRRHTFPAIWAARCAGRLEVHVHGACVGAGFEIAAFATRFTASRRAWFQLPELAMGLLPGAGGCVSLTRRIGRQRTAELIFSGKRLSARKALEWGLIDALLDDALLDDSAMDKSGADIG